MPIQTDTIGYIASLLVLMTFFATDARMLRISAIASNLAFIVYASLTGVGPIFILHVALLPLNICRLAQAVRQTSRHAQSPS